MSSTNFSLMRPWGSRGVSDVVSVRMELGLIRTSEAHTLGDGRAFE